VKMRISGAFASETETRGTAKAQENPLDAGARRRRVPIGYIVAVTWVVLALGLYAFQMIRLAAGRG
jgi:hypothetical protein